MTGEVPCLELRDVGKRYGRRVVLEHVDLSIARGELVAVVGSSGSGKTTLISLMAGLVLPDAGRVFHDGLAIDGPGPERAVVFQNYSLLPWLSVYDNVRLAVDQVCRDWPAARRREHIEAHIAMVNLSAARDKKPAALSGGMRQRVAVARALAMQPRVLLLDEPLGALDALTRGALQEEIARIWARTACTGVLITNDVDEAILLADRIIPLGGRTLGPTVPVYLPRPRDRRALNHDPEFQRLRREVFGLLHQVRAA